MKRPSILAAPTLCFLVLVAASHAKPPGYAIVGVNVVDVEAGKLIPAQTVLIAGDKIGRIGPSADLTIPDAYEKIEAAGKFLIPGLFDAHVHYVDPDTYGRMMIANGVTFVRDMAGFTAPTIELRDKLNSGRLLGPEMICTGAILDGNPPIWPFSEVCETPEQGRAAVNKLADAGVNQIKVYSNLKKAPYIAICDEARKRGLKPVGHVPEAVTLEDALKAGQASCEHLTGFGAAIARLADHPISPTTQALRSHVEGFKAWSLLPTIEKSKLDAFARQVRDSGIVQCPTLVVFQGISRLNDSSAAKDKRLRYVSAAMQTFWNAGRLGDFAKYAAAGIPYMKQMIAALHRAGVPLICGTDLANPYVFAGFSLHDEMAMFQDAGIPPADVLKSATLVPAQFCGVGDRLGRVAEGKTSSLVLLNANPLSDIANAKQIEAVFLRGRYFDRTRLSKLLREAREQVAGAAPIDVATKLEVPGKELIRGRYTSTFNEMDAGDEEFVISQADDGFHLMAHVRPKGGWAVPSVTEMHVDPAYALRTLNWHEMKKEPTEAKWVAKDGKVEGNASLAGGKTESQSFALPANVVISGPASAMDFFANNLQPLAVGETRELHLAGFGFEGWKMQIATAKLTRKPDVDLTLANGKSVKARYFESTMQIPIGTIETRTWTDDRGLTLKTISKMPFGTVAVVLDQK